MPVNSSQKVGAVFAAWCKFNEAERAEFDSMVAAVKIHLTVQTQSTAGTKAAATRKANKQQKPAEVAAAGSL